jgi:hypothetical protein
MEISSQIILSVDKGAEEKDALKPTGKRNPLANTE